MVISSPGSKCSCLKVHRVATELAPVCSSNSNVYVYLSSLAHENSQYLGSDVTVCMHCYKYCIYTMQHCFFVLFYWQNTYCREYRRAGFFFARIWFSRTRRIAKIKSIKIWYQLNFWCVQLLCSLRFCHVATAASVGNSLAWRYSSMIDLF